MDKIIFQNENLKVVTNIDLGWTLDEYNNFLIDVFTTYKKQFKDEIPLPSEPITFTIMPEWFNK